MLIQPRPAGLELKRDFVAGDLHDSRRAAVPIAPALGEVIAPALPYPVVNLGTGGEALRGRGTRHAGRTNSRHVGYSEGSAAAQDSGSPVAHRSQLPGFHDPLIHRCSGKPAGGWY